MSHQAPPAEIKPAVGRVEEIGLKTELSRGEERTVIGVIGGNAYAYRDAFSHLGGIQEIVPITKPFKLASREFRRQDTVVDVGGVKIGNHEVVVMAGPCSVEGEEMLLETARHVAKQGARVLRGGAFKPRTSRYSPSTPTSSSWGLATCRTTRCCRRPDAPANPCCSNAACHPPSRSGCWRLSTSCRRATAT